MVQFAAPFSVLCAQAQPMMSEPRDSPAAASLGRHLHPDGKNADVAQ